MATVGQQLTAPEAGWKRYDDINSNFSYVGNSWGTHSDSGLYNGAVHYTYTAGDYVTFNFSGDKLRLIGSTSTATFRSNSIDIYIDGELAQTINQATGSAVVQTLDFSIIGLSDTEHSVKIVNNQTKAANSGTGYVFDAIDIDENGELKPYNPTLISSPANLTATPGNAQVTLNWDAVTGATGYNVKRSITAGGPYTTIASNVVTNSYTDTPVTNGTTYYYVVTALSGTSESANSNEASATPVAPINVLLRITMNDSSEREYPVTAAEINGFINWFNQHTSTDATSFMFNKTVGSQTSKEYLAFDKIISFEVIPLPAV